MFEARLRSLSHNTDLGHVLNTNNRLERHKRDVGMSGTKATIRADSRMRSAVAGEARSQDHSLVLLDSVVIQQHYLYTI